MNEFFNEAQWRNILKDPLWYLELHSEYQRLGKLIHNHPEKREPVKEQLYAFFEHALQNNEIALAKTGLNLDAERKPIDTIVIHHTKHSPGITWRKLSAIQLIRLYTGYEGRKENQEKIFRERKPIYSNHFRNGEQVFYSYHWLIRENGDCERLLNDNEIGWQAGDWDINCRSIALCIDNDHEHTSPSAAVIAALAALIKKYPQVLPDRIFGHREINKNTTCPGNTFLGEWKGKVLADLLRV